VPFSVSQPESDEETLCRGFLLHYLRVFSFTLNLTLALLISSVISGLGHLYQGVGGAASTVVIGLPFGLLFLLTGNLAVLRHPPDRSAVLRQTVFLSRYSRGLDHLSARAQIMPFQNARIPRQTCD
jgi:Type II CAAX prenyl endopeptidase Rce1-like